MQRAAKLFLGGCVALAMVAAFASIPQAEARRGDGGIVYVTSQGLFFDTFVTKDPLPRHGKFQKLEMGGPMGANGSTEFGPGDSGYRGGRWWMDVNGNGEMDDMDHYFLCPLLGPGREAP